MRADDVVSWLLDEWATDCKYSRREVARVIQELQAQLAEFESRPAVGSPLKRLQRATERVKQLEDAIVQIAAGCSDADTTDALDQLVASVGPAVPGADETMTLGFLIEDPANPLRIDDLIKMWESRCLTCHGTGVIKTQAVGVMKSVFIVCPKCAGTGSCATKGSTR